MNRTGCRFWSEQGFSDRLGFFFFFFFKYQQLLRARGSVGWAGWPAGTCGGCTGTGQCWRRDWLSVRRRRTRAGQSGLGARSAEVLWNKKNAAFRCDSDGPTFRLGKSSFLRVLEQHGRQKEVVLIFIAQTSQTTRWQLFPVFEWQGSVRKTTQ